MRSLRPTRTTVLGGAEEGGPRLVQTAPFRRDRSRVLPLDRSAATATRGAAREGEDQAVTWLKRRGYRMIARNAAHGGGELDLVAGEGGTLCFVEVRARAGRTLRGALAAVAPPRLRRLFRAARSWLSGTRRTAHAASTSSAWTRRSGRRGRRPGATPWCATLSRRGGGPAPEGGGPPGGRYTGCPEGRRPGVGRLSSLLAVGGREAIRGPATGSGNSSVVEHNLAKVGVAGSNPVSRSNTLPRSTGQVGRRERAALVFLVVLKAAAHPPPGRRSQVVRQGSAKPSFLGSIPGVASS